MSKNYSQNTTGIELCYAYQANNLISDSAAEKALDKILGVIGASKNFILIPCDNINNAVATVFKGERFILYDKDFMSRVNLNSNNWSSLFILAHEVGHHINGHSLDLLLYVGDVIDTPSLEKKRKQELEADEFAGFILAKLGASLEETKSVIKLISNDVEDRYSTHPNKSKRLFSVEKGYYKGTTNDPVSIKRLPKKIKKKLNVKDFFKEDNLISDGNILGYTNFFETAPNLKLGLTNDRYYKIIVRSYLYLDPEDLPYYHESLSGKDIIKGNKEFRANVYFLDNNNNVIKEEKNKTFEAGTNENRPSYFYNSSIEFRNMYRGTRPKENFDTGFENVSKIVIKLISIKTLKNNDDKVFELNNTLKKIKKKKSKLDDFIDVIYDYRRAFPKNNKYKPRKLWYNKLTEIDSLFYSLLNEHDYQKTRVKNWYEYYNSTNKFEFEGKSFFSRWEFLVKKRTQQHLTLIESIKLYYYNPKIEKIKSKLDSLKSNFESKNFNEEFLFEYDLPNDLKIDKIDPEY